jgi:hypothetical protein
MSKRVIFLKLYATNGDVIQFIPLVHAFYAFKFLLFYNHHNHESNVAIIPFAMGTCQGDPLRWALFTLTHLKFYVL